ncbi:MAG TPA: type II secretion system F family protein [Smithellaceae bacterium]|nr:type II secretion system F family protein [Smithellaceae bacterium]HRS83420.1 type II secretion system F family protein [Smithellaceae bacterium]HRV45564.1 type II secretion system F family protein [Smithellaceae bacterium]
MPVFLWEATTKKGEVKKGEMDLADEMAVRTALRRQGFKSVTVKPKPKDLLENIPFLQGGVEEKNVVVFCRIFSTMIDAGLPLIQCLSILAEQEENKTFAKILRTIKEDIEGGTSLTDALKKHPKVFDDLFVNLIAAGEAGGILDLVLARLSSYLENAMKLKAAVKSAMTYPITVLCIAAGVVTLLLLKVIPTFQKMFSDMGGELPGPTAMVVAMSEFMQNYWWVLGGIVAAIVIGLKMFYKTEKGHWTIDAFLLKAPLIGNVLRKVAVAKFTRTLATMMSSGVPILEGLNIVSKTAGNVVIEAAVVKTRQAISEGQSIAEPLSASGVFPPMVVQMIAVGEATGALDIMLNKIADFYDDEVDAAVKGMTAMIEPIMMVFLGGVCGGMIIAMYLPIFKMASVVG